MTSVRPVIFDSTLGVMAPAADCGAGFAGIWGIAASILSLNCEAGMAAKVLRAVSMRVISCVVASRIVVKSPLVERPLFPFMRKEDDLRSEEHTSELQSLTHIGCRFLKDTATAEISTLSLHDALPISCVVASRIVVKSPLVERPLFPFMRKEDDL